MPIHMILVVWEYGQDCPSKIPEITIAFEDDGPLGRGMGSPRPETIFSNLSNYEHF